MMRAPAPPVKKLPVPRRWARRWLFLFRLSGDFSTLFKEGESIEIRYLGNVEVLTMEKTR